MQGLEGQTASWAAFVQPDHTWTQCRGVAVEPRLSLHSVTSDLTPQACGHSAQSRRSDQAPAPPWGPGPQ